MTEEKLKIRDARGGDRYFIDNALLKDGYGAKLGPHGIAVYSALVLHANLDEQSCWPSYQRIADLTGMTRRTAIAQIERLTELHIIAKERRSDGVKGNLSNVYVLLHPSEWASLGSEYSSLGPVQEVHHPSETDSPEQDPIEQDPIKQEQAAFIKQAEEQDKLDGRSWFLALTELCAVDLAVATKTQKDQVGQTAKILRNAEVTPEQIVAFGEWWYAEDWRGKTGQSPTPAQVRSEWGKFKRAGGGERRVVRLGR